MTNSPQAINVFGEPLELCSQAPLTGFQRDGFCHLTALDYGQHDVCAVVDDEFLAFTREQGNDLSTPRPEWGFPGLRPGDRWCLCIDRWLEAHRLGKAPKLVLSACHHRLLDSITLEELKEFNAEH